MRNGLTPGGPDGHPRRARACGPTAESSQTHNRPRELYLGIRNGLVS